MRTSSRARELARKLLVLTGAHTPDRIDPIASAKELDIEIAYGQLIGAKARIFRVGAQARIRVSDQIVTVACERATVAHELGHFVCGHELARDGDGQSWLRTSCERRTHRIEREADVFSVEHLTPEPMVLPYCRRTPVDLFTVNEIERVFRVSPVLAALRLVELSTEACAVVYSEHGHVRWMRGSSTFPTRLPFGTRVAPGSIAQRHFEGRVLSGDPQTCPAPAWLGRQCCGVDELELAEHSVIIPEPGWGGVMSVLWLPGLAACDHNASFAHRQEAKALGVDMISVSQDQP
jgi:hypothetical protein